MGNGKNRNQVQGNQALGKVGRTGVSCIESRGHSCLRTKLLIIDGETTDINPILNLSELLRVSRE